MNMMMKKAAAAATLVAAVVALTVTPSQARWRTGEAAAAGFVAGAAVGTVATSAYYGPRYYGGPYASYGYGYGPSYGYGYGYASEPSYASTTVYAAPPSCWVTTDDAKGYGYYGACRPGQAMNTRLKKTPNN